MSLADLATWTLSTLDTHDLDPGGCGRFRQMAQTVLSGDNEIIPANDPRSPLVRQAMKDLREMHFTWSVLGPQPSDRLLWSRLKLAMRKGAPLLRESRRCAARDAQFELLGRAMLARAGLAPQATNAHADFICNLGSAAIAVECKRVTSMDAIEREMSHAAKQVDRLSMPGIILMDYSDAVNPTDHVVLRYPGDKGIRDAFRRRAEYFWLTHGPKILTALKGSRIASITLLDHLIIHAGLDPTNPTLGRWEYQTYRDTYSIPATRQTDREACATASQLIADLGLPNAG